MFLEKIYNDKIQLGKNQEKSIQKSRSQTMNVNKINFDKDERVFFNENIPKKALESHKHIQEFIDPDILQLKKKQWNPSITGYAYDVPFDRQLMKMRLGHQLYMPKIQNKQRPSQMDSRNPAGSTEDWNQSVEIDKKDIKNRYNNLTLFSTQGTKYKNFNLIQFDEKNKISLVQRQTEYNENIRNQKKEEDHIRQHLKNQYLSQNPNTSVEKVNSIVYKITDYHRHQMKFNQDRLQQQDEYPFKPQLKNMNKKLTYKYSHDGTWKEFSKQYENKEKKIYHAWSCCMKNKQDAEGCVKIKVDGNKWIK